MKTHNPEQGYFVRYAEAGEFSKRAFQNGVLDLTQVEGIRDSIDAETETQRKAAMAPASGRMKIMYDDWRKQIVDTMALLTALIDFSEDSDITSAKELFNQSRGKVNKLLGEIKDHYKVIKRSELLVSGIRLDFLGPPNAGKSYLLNRLAERDAAIVSDVPGTTRDVLELSMDISGYKVVLGDTAGLRSVSRKGGLVVKESTDDLNYKIELEGMKRAKQRFKNSDIVLCILPLSQDPTSVSISPDVLAEIKDLQNLDKRIIVALNKEDLVDSAVSLEDVKAAYANTLQVPKDDILSVSCLTEKGITDLVQKLVSNFENMTIDTSSQGYPIGASQRTKDILQNEVVAGLEGFLAIDDETEVVIATEELRFAAEGIGKITGQGKFEELESIDTSSYFKKAIEKKKESSPQKDLKPESEVTVISDDDVQPVQSSRNLRATKKVTEPVKKNVKETKPKTDKKTATHDDNDFDLSDAFDDDDDFDMIDVAPVKPVKAASKKVAKTVQKASPVKAKPAPTPKPAPRSTPKASVSIPAAKPTASTGAGLTSDDILKNIPDAILPEVDSSKKFNYFALKAAKDSAAQPSGDLVIPQARENCLAGMTFVFTGNLPRLPREEGQDIVKKYGGKVTASPSSKTTCVVLGAEAGPSKIEKIKKFGIKAIDEDGFLQLLSEMPADGGSGAAAQKAVLKQKEEQKKVEIAVKEMSRNDGLKNKGKASNGDSDGDLWTTKYAPSELSHICGNKGLVEKLGRWLRAWRSNAKKGFKSAGPDGSGIYRAVIISGPPGIGKTTAAHLVAKLNGFDVIESNASDTRSKNMLISKVMGSTKNTSLSGFLSNAPQDASKKNICLIMDEVDGMSGGDRGGVGQMAALCRTTNVPIILICNERSLPKMRPFDRVALDMQFRRPDANALRIRIMGIANKEGIRVTPQVVDQLVSSSGSDMRQIINMLYTYSRTHKKMDFQTSQDFSKAFEKSITLKPFDITAKLLSGSTFAPNSGLSLDDKIRLYFDDHDFTPLMIQENYLNTHPSSVNNGKFKSHLDAVVAASESISDGDLVDKRIHGSQPQWSLMPFHGVMSSVLPSSYVAGQGRGRYNFTTYLGQNSKTNKYARLLQEVQSHARLKISGDKKEVRLQYLPLLSNKLIEPLLSNGDGGISQVIEVMDEYFLTKEDWDVIMELGVGPLSNEAKAKGLPTAVKSAFTRNYNKASHPVPFMKSSSMFSAKATAAAMPTEVPDLEETVGEEVPVAEDDADDKDKDEDEDLSKDKYIKVSKPKAPAKRGTKKAATAAGGSGKAKTARGKGRATTR